MPLSVKVTPWSQSFQVLVDETLSPQARNDKVASEARRIIAAADAQNRAVLGAVPPKKVTVNGHQDDELRNVVPPDSGIIIAEYRLAEDVLKWIMETLRVRSPILSGAYRDAHKMFADDIEADVEHPPMASTYMFMNTVPYARKIEVGKTKSGRDFVIQVPNRIYERTAKDAQARFGNLVKIRSGFASTTQSYTLKTSFRRRKGRQAGDVLTVPAIYVTFG